MAPTENRATAPPRTAPTTGFCLAPRSEEHTSELQSQSNLVCRLLLEKTTGRRKFDVQLVTVPHSSSDDERYLAHVHVRKIIGLIRFDAEWSEACKLTCELYTKGAARAAVDLQPQVVVGAAVCADVIQLLDAGGVALEVGCDLEPDTDEQFLAVAARGNVVPAVTGRAGITSPALHPC